MSKDQSIDKLLNHWKDDFQADPYLSSRVRSEAARRQTIEGKRGDSVAIWIGNAFSRPGLAACFAAVFMLVGMGVSQLLNQGVVRDSDELTFSYRLSIDPLYRLQAMAGADEFTNRSVVPARHKSQEAPVLLAGLGWLQGQLDLSKPQYERVTALHGDYEVAFDELFAQLLESHRAYRAFDKKRMDSDVIDYFQLYELLQTQKQLSEESARLTEELLGKVEQVIEPSQRDRYRELLDSIYPSFSFREKKTTDA
ncbi:hypothetical protein VDG1235_2661 [Verrucomicrobiia bacterium DG1235]|nr:hypothetical protein VDG1235_2661 [Verrucomicrobiae bacterium DG1235]